MEGHVHLRRREHLECGVTLEWRPYTLRIPNLLGSAEVNERGERVADARNAHQWRRVKYIYMDCRRLAARRGLTFHAPRKVFESFVAHVGMLYARRRGAFQRYHDTVYERFWRRELDVDSVAEISQLLRSIGVGAEEFPAFVEGAGRLEHDHIMDEAHALGVFGVPSFIVDGELYWGGEHLPALRERLGRGARRLSCDQHLGAIPSKISSVPRTRLKPQDGRTTP